MSARYQLSKRIYVVGVAVMLYLHLSGTTSTTSNPDTTNNRSTVGQTASYNSMSTDSDTSYSNAITSPAPPNSSLITTINTTSDNSITTSIDRLVKSTTIRSDTSVSSASTSPAISVSSTSTSPAISVSSTSTSPAISVSSMSTSPAMSVSSTIKSPDSSISSNKTSADIPISRTTNPYTLVSGITSRSETSVSNITTSPYTSVSRTTHSDTSVSKTTPFDTSVIKTTISPDSSISITTPNTTTPNTTTPNTDTPVSRTTISHNTSIISTTANTDTPVSRTTISHNTSIISTTTNTDTPVSRTTISHNTSIISTTTNTDTPVSRTTISPTTSIISTTTNTDTPVSRTTISHNTSIISTTEKTDILTNSLTTSPVSSISSSTTHPYTPFSSTPAYQLSSTSTTASSTTIPTITRDFFIGEFVNVSADDCATIGKKFQFRCTTTFDIYANYFRTIHWIRSDTLQHVYLTLRSGYCDVYDIDYKFSGNCSSTGDSFILDMNEVTGDDIGYNWTVQIDLQRISHSLPVRHCGSADEVNTTSQECATLGERFRLRATYDFHSYKMPIHLIRWMIPDKGYLMNFRINNHGSVSVDGIYDKTKYSGYGNSTENEYFVEINNVTNTDLDVNWTVMTYFNAVSEPITVTLCDCPDQYFGENCTQECDCNGEPCNATTGVCLPDCGNPSAIENGDVSYNDTLTNSTAIYKCEVGYYLVGTSAITCDPNGTWVGDVPKCQLVDCGEPTEVSHSLVNLNATTFNATAIYTCVIGYNMTGDDILTCREDGTWDGDKPVCRIVDCGFPRNITDGQYTLVGSTAFSSIALYTCYAGFKLNDTNNRKRCEAAGIWTGEIGTCVRLECRSLSPPTDGVIAYSNENKTATFSCNSGFRLIGRNKLFCESTGNWSETVPKCEKVEAEIKYCQKDEDKRGTMWNETSPGQIVTSQCPEGQEGTISRQCYQTGDWKLPRYTCVQKEISEAESKIDVIESSNITEEVKAEIVSDVLDTLSNSTAATVSSVNAGMGDGEIEKVTSILERVASISQDIVVTEKQSENFIGTTSNLLNQQNSGSFRSLEENKDQNGTSPAGADKVLEVVGNFAKAIGNSLDKLNGSKTIQTDNMVVTVSKFDEDEDIQFPLRTSLSSNMDSSTFAEMPHSGLKGVGSYSGIFYSNLSGLLSPRIHDEGSEAKGNFEMNAAVIDMQLLNTTGTPPNFKIILNFDNFKIGNHETKCCFWNFTRRSWDTSGCELDTDKTNKSITVCTCKHTTNFAILMNPHETKNVVSKVLDYITLVGCSISMVCLIVTVVMHAALWRYLKSDRAIILINLSIALILSYATFVFGVDKTENKVVCTAVAVALHYIYLVVFFLMLSEGIEILITVVYVFVMKSRLRRLLLMSWGLPAIIVGTSVAVTQSDGYGSDKYCWLSVHSGLIWAFVGPALAIILANFVQLCIVIKAMFKVRTLKERSRIEKVKTGVRCLCVLLPLTGGTWVIGVFYVDENWAWIQYAFAVLNGLQGVFIMLFHCVTNSQIKIAISRRMKLYRASTAYSRSSNNPTPRSSAQTELYSNRHERSTESYNDSRDLIEDSFQRRDRHSIQLKGVYRGRMTSFS